MADIYDVLSTCRFCWRPFLAGRYLVAHGKGEYCSVSCANRDRHNKRLLALAAAQGLPVPDERPANV